MVYHVSMLCLGKHMQALVGHALDCQKLVVCCSLMLDCLSILAFHLLFKLQWSSECLATSAEQRQTLYLSCLS